MSIEYHPKYNDKISPVVDNFLQTLSQNVSNVNIRLFGSVTNFTHFKDKSDVDCCIIYPDEYTRMKLCEFIEGDSIKFNKTRVLFREMTLRNKDYADEHIGLYVIEFDNKHKLDICLVDGNIGPIQRQQHNFGIMYKLFMYVIKWLYYGTGLISKENFIYLKRQIFVWSDSNRNINVVFSKHQIRRGTPH